jgi:Family of unknown function (DUF6502)
MPKQQQKPKRVLLTKELNKRKLNEVSVDDIIKQLLDLFDHLGVDSGLLASRFTHLKSARVVSKRIYPHIAAIGELLTSWHQNPNYLDGSGQPLPLKMQGTRRSFTKLAKRSVPKIHPKRLLSELEQVGAVAIDSKKYIRVQMRSLPVYEDRRLAMQHTLTSLDSFIKTLRHNLNSPPSNSDQLFHRIAGNGAFDVRDIPALKIRVKRHAQSFLESSDNWMAKRLTTRRRNSRSKVAQVAIGVYLSVVPL